MELVSQSVSESVSQSVSQQSVSAGQEFPHLLRNLKLHYHVQKSPPLVPVLSQGTYLQYEIRTH